MRGMSLEVHAVKKIEVSEMTESGGGEYYYRIITLTLQDGQEVNVTAYSVDDDEEALVVQIK
jgi:hypothetical protein